MNITIYHNPRCSKSRETLELLTTNGIEPKIVPYLEEPPSAETTLALARSLGVPVQEILRRGEDDYRQAADALDLGNDRQLAEWLVEHPRALQRPIVVDDDSGRAVIGRPPANVLALLKP